MKTLTISRLDFGRQGNEYKILAENNCVGEIKVITKLWGGHSCAIYLTIMNAEYELYNNNNVITLDYDSITQDDDFTLQELQELEASEFLEQILNNSAIFNKEFFDVEDIKLMVDDIFENNNSINIFLNQYCK